jgi:hypothetical protein
MRSAVQLHKKGTLSPPSGREERLGVPDSRRNRLPHPHILGTLRDTMRVTLRGEVSWRWCPPELHRQPTQVKQKSSSFHEPVYDNPRPSLALPLDVVNLHIPRSSYWIPGSSLVKFGVTGCFYRLARGRDECVILRKSHFIQGPLQTA